MVINPKHTKGFDKNLNKQKKASENLPKPFFACAPGVTFLIKGHVIRLIVFVAEIARPGNYLLNGNQVINIPAGFMV